MGYCGLVDKEPGGFKDILFVFGTSCSGNGIGWGDLQGAAALFLSSGFFG